MELNLHVSCSMVNVTMRGTVNFPCWLGKRIFATIIRSIPLLLVPFLLLLSVFIGRNGAEKQGVLVRSARIASSRQGHPFAIDDFDGDHRLDFANIHSVRTQAARSNYFIQLQLSSGGRRSLDLEAPSGGLIIEARDVHGDKALDLVLTTSLHQRPVAILLNDGRGSFSLATPAEFPGPFLVRRGTIMIPKPVDLALENRFSILVAAFGSTMCGGRRLRA